MLARGLTGTGRQATPFTPMCLLFDGAGDFLSFNHISAFNLTGDSTISMHIRVPYHDTSHSLRRLFHNGYNYFANEYGRYCEISYDSNGYHKLKQSWHDNSGNVNDACVHTGGTFNTTSWMYVFFEKEGQVSRIFNNSVASSSNKTLPASTIAYPCEYRSIGNGGTSSTCAQTDSGTAAHVYMDDVRIYNRILSQTEKAQVVTERDLPSTSVVDGLLARYGFDEGVANQTASGALSILDSSGNERHITPGGSCVYKAAGS